MNIEGLSNFLKESSLDLAENYCIVNRRIVSLKEVECMGCNEFSLFSKKNMPLKLYKYFPNKWEVKDNIPVNYSLLALKNNTVYMQSPDLFDDVYDSNIHIEWKEYAYTRLRIYCQRCKCSTGENLNFEELLNSLSNLLQEVLNSSQNIQAVFGTDENEMVRLTNEIFANRILLLINRNVNLSEAIIQALEQEYIEYTKQLQKTFRTTCFATTPFSQLMWGGSYADCHKGFCIEYTIDPNIVELQNQYSNLFPMVYCSVRPDVTKEIIKTRDKAITDKELWSIYFHGALRKSIDWTYQDEWRLLLPFNKATVNFNVKFFPITKVYLGNRMNKANRQEIIEICHKKNIPYAGVTKDNNKFQMRECNTLCEECPNFQSKR
ncbi:MAG: DUF2971 domain-containing protein [Lachnospiraceae bacterium]|nr:DUF2971 domain-containing protein [Lachnospiraceae bacterium]